MADEYRIYQISSEVIHDGAPLGGVRFYMTAGEVIHTGADPAPLTIYAINAEVIHTGDDPGPIQIAHIQPEIVRDIADRYEWAFIDDGDLAFDGFSYSAAYGWAFIDDSASAFFPFSLLVVPAVKTEWNPLRPDIPPEIADSDPNLYDYLREQAEILREQHDLTQAGGTTFPWELMFQTSEEPQFQLGALSRFYHQDYGILLGRYVQFSDRWSNGTQGPVGRDLKYGDWVVTNQLDKSHNTQLLGVSVAYAEELANLYGWVMVYGRGLTSLRIEADERPVDFQGFTWTDTARAGIGPGLLLGRVIDSDALGAFAASLWVAPIGGWFCELQGVTDEYIAQITAGDLNELSDRLDAVENAIETQIVDYQPQLDTINNSITNLTNGLARESEQRALVNNSFLQRIQALESAAQNPGPSSGDFFSLADRVSTLETVTVPRVDTLRSEMLTVQSTLSGHGTSITFLEGQTAALLSSITSLDAQWLTIDSLGDVDTSTAPPSDGDTLIWSSADSEWQPGPIVPGSMVIDDLTDVDTTTVAPSDGDVLTWSAADSEWVPDAPAGGSGSNPYEASPTSIPTLASFATWRNQGTATATADAYGVYLGGDNDGELHIREMNVPSLPVSYYARIRTQLVSTDAITASIYVQAGFVVVNSTSGRALTACTTAQRIAGDENIVYWGTIDRWSSMTVNAATVTAGYDNTPVLWLRVDLTSTTITLFASKDGRRWTQVATDTYASYVTATGGSVDKFGIFIRSAGTGPTFAFFDVLQTTAP